MNEHLPKIPARLGSNPIPPASTAPELQEPPPSLVAIFDQLEAKHARDVLRCLLSYESVRCKRTDAQEDNDSSEPHEDVLVPLHVLQQAREALGISKK